jgi:hypothetical protein
MATRKEWERLVLEEAWSENRLQAGYNTIVTVHAKDGTDRDVAICAGDDAEKIGKDVIAAIHGTRLFQLSVRVR